MKVGHMQITLAQADTPKLDDPMREDLVRVFAQSLRLLARRAESKRKSADAPRYWDEWDLFHRVAYASGFVCNVPDDCPGYEASFRNIIGGVDMVSALGLDRIRLAMTFMMRSERWGDSGNDTGGGAVWSLLRSGRAGEISDRLEAIIRDADQ